ncbi:MAG: hypothetical protein FD174_655 [Geobacteraceae bacterium]|nr:MAG: hypothetical protein FD174_655 [Geobacteraceae bacterium]
MGGDDCVRKYLNSRAIKGPWQISGPAEGGFAGAVVIPALAEGDNLFATLCSLARNPADLLTRFLVLVVVNHRTDAPPEDKADNYGALTRLATGEPALRPLKLAWVDAASQDLELPVKGGGVGMARKIGLDLALTRLDHENADPLLISLDADTLVEPSYLPAISNHFHSTTAGGAVLHFRHQEGCSGRQQQAIERYELFLRSYVLGLELAGSPYAFHTVGSAMGCRASAYARMGGMNGRTAGEDFYFLQQLHRTTGVKQVGGTVVHPSARASHRVPFGTGRSVSRLLALEEGAVLFYRPECFRLLKEWLDLVRSHPAGNGEELRAKAACISSHLGTYLDNVRFEAVWEKLRKNHRDWASLSIAFHCWFDGLKTMKLIHHLSAAPLPRCGPEEALPGLLEWAGAKPVNGLDRQLALLREMQLGKDCPKC